MDIRKNRHGKAIQTWKGMLSVKHRKLVLLGMAVLITLSLLAISGPSVAADKVFNWKFQSHQYTPPGPLRQRKFKALYRKVEKMSGGRLKISLHYAGERGIYRVDEAPPGEHDPDIQYQLIVLQGSHPHGLGVGT